MCLACPVRLSFVLAPHVQRRALSGYRIDSNPLYNSIVPRDDVPRSGIRRIDHIGHVSKLPGKVQVIIVPGRPQVRKVNGGLTVPP